MGVNKLVEFQLLTGTPGTDKETKNMVLFAKSYLAHKMNKTYFSIKGTGDNKQAPGFT